MSDATRAGWNESPDTYASVPRSERIQGQEEIAYGNPGLLRAPIRVKGALYVSRFSISLNWTYFAKRTILEIPDSLFFLISAVKKNIDDLINPGRHIFP